MGNGAKKIARLIQEATGWSYQRAVNYMRDNEEEANAYANEAGILAREAIVQMATAEAEESDE